jgi:hypothetical protein
MQLVDDKATFKAYEYDHTAVRWLGHVVDTRRLLLDSRIRRLKSVFKRLLSIFGELLLLEHRKVEKGLVM